MTENTPSDAMVEAMARAMALEANDYEGPELQWQCWTDSAQAAAAVIADALAERDAEIARLQRALRNIRALATKRQNVCGPDGCLTDIECFARTALGSAKV